MTEHSTRHAFLDSPIGTLTLIAEDDAIVEVWFPNHSADPTAALDDSTLDPGHPVLARASAQLDEYFAGTRTEFDVPLAPDGTPFQLAAWGALTTIPYGETVSYGEQASRLGDPNKARAVGAANGRNPIPIIVPCHRVIGANGHLTGFGGGVESKAWLLDHEQRVRREEVA
jgi:methylated-DNA-[protein]-cysteine S-methyltransferase